MSEPQTKTSFEIDDDDINFSPHDTFHFADDIANQNPQNMHDSIIDIGDLPDGIIDVGDLPMGIIDVGDLPMGIIDIGDLPDGIIDVGDLPDGMTHEHHMFDMMV